ncbi:MAG TPA: amidohydrolase family protein [Gemmatimonadaceae bacterium]|nr:amidohydrolase family protein [Gemmatimonadaceae bacterium]
MRENSIRQLVAAAAFAAAAGAQQGPPLPLGTTRTVAFTTSEGTWMSIDVSPDRSTILFDLLGDIYTVPIAGGKATRVTSGNAIDGQARYSPDGRSIVFISDRGGADATWLADADGKRARQLVAGGHYPAWTPDGAQIVTGNRLVDVRGGAGLVVPGFGTAPTFTADGRYIWFQQGTQAVRYDREKGRTSYNTNVAGGAYRPIVNRDGTKLAYFTRFESQTALVIRDLANGAEQWVSMGTQPPAGTPAAGGGRGGRGGGRGGGGRGGAASPSGVGPLPSSAWLADGSAIITSFGGHIWRIDVPSGRKAQIAFTADVEQSLGPLVKSDYTISDSVQAREIREPALSPDGRRVAFSSLGKVWVMDLQQGASPRRLTAANNVVESSPTWTPDGRSIAFATWADGDGGDIFQVEASGGTPRNLTRAPAMYTRLNFSTDGSRLVFARAPRRARTAIVDDQAPGELNLDLRWMPAGGGAQRTITTIASARPMPLGGFPHFTSDTSRVFYQAEDTGLVSVRWDGSDRAVLLANAAPRTLIAPDGHTVVSQATRRNHLYLFALPQGPDSLTIDPAGNNPPVPVRRITRIGGDFPSWSRTGSHVVWSSGTTIHVYDLARGNKATADSIAAALARTGDDSTSGRGGAGRGGGGAGGGRGGGGGGGGGAQDSVLRWTPAYDADRYDVRIVVAADKPAGTTVLRGARIVTMNGAEVIENGDIVITGNRIAAVGARGRVTIPNGARAINVAGKTIVPGYVDVHGRLSAPAQVHGTIVPTYLTDLAFGVTTVRDPEVEATDILTYADRVATGELLGPRVLSTGPAALDSGLTVRTLAEGRTYMPIFANAWRTGTVRGEYTGTRADRQRFLQISKELGLTAVASGTTDYRKSLSAILDGYADHQEAYEVFPFFGDLAQLIAKSGLTYTPMLTGRVGDRNGLDYIRATENPHGDTRVQRFYPHADVDRQTRGRGSWISPDEYPFADIAGSAARVVAQGGSVAIGTGERLPGLAFHWEMLLLAKGGMKPHDILRAATVSGANVLGLSADIGAIATGKLADLVVLDRDPLTDIRNTTSIRYVMKNGRLYDATTLDQVAPAPQKSNASWWVAANAAGGQR